MITNWPYHISIKYYKRINQENLKYWFIPDLALKCKFPGCFLESPQNCYNIIYLVYEKSQWNNFYNSFNLAPKVSNNIFKVILAKPTIQAYGAPWTF